MQAKSFLADAPNIKTVINDNTIAWANSKDPRNKPRFCVEENQWHATVITRAPHQWKIKRHRSSKPAGKRRWEPRAARNKPPRPKTNRDTQRQ